MAHSYVALYYHLVWSTKYRNKFLKNELTPKLQKFFENKASEINCQILAMNCVGDHVHLLISISPSIAVSTVIKTLKGSSSRMLKDFIADFSWQEGYGVFTLRNTDLSVVQDYIANQKKHHQEHTTNELWESPPQD